MCLQRQTAIIASISNPLKKACFHIHRSYHWTWLNTPATDIHVQGHITLLACWLWYKLQENQLRASTFDVGQAYEVSLQSVKKLRMELAPTLWHRPIYQLYDDSYTSVKHRWPVCNRLVRKKAFITAIPIFCIICTTRLTRCGYSFCV